MPYLEEIFEEKIEESKSRSFFEKSSKKKRKVTYLVFTTTSITMGILILVTILAILSGTISHTTILVDVLMIIWHFILMVRISLVEKELDAKKAKSSELVKKEEIYDENIDWI